MRVVRTAGAVADRPAGGSVILLHAPTRVLGMYVRRMLAAYKGHPTKIRYVFNEPLEQSNSIFLAWRDLALRRIPPPEVGERLLLQRTPDMPRP
jgi:hypothetical protein